MITQAVTLHPYSEPLAHDYERYTTGQVMIETADRLVTEEGEPALQQFQLLVGALQALTAGTSDGVAPADHGDGRLPAAGGRPRRLRAHPRRLRPLRRSGPARGVLAAARRHGVPALPSARFGPSRPGDGDLPRCAAGRRLGRRPGRFPLRPCGRAAAWWPPSSAGISTTGCVRSATSTGRAQPTDSGVTDIKLLSPDVTNGPVVPVTSLVAGNEAARYREHIEVTNTVNSLVGVGFHRTAEPGCEQ